MNRNPYLTTAEIQQLVLISGICKSLPHVVEQTKDKSWNRKMKTCVTYLEGILRERIGMVPSKDAIAIARRAERTVVRFFTSDQLKTDKREGFSSDDKTVTMDYEDAMDFYEMALQGCLCCKQGDCVKNCKWRKLYHKHGFPVGRENPNEGECEFRWDNEVRAVDPFTLQKVVDVF